MCTCIYIYARFVERPRSDFLLETKRVCGKRPNWISRAFPQFCVLSPLRDESKEKEISEKPGIAFRRSPSVIKLLCVYMCVCVGSLWICVCNAQSSVYQDLYCKAEERVEKKGKIFIILFPGSEIFWSQPLSDSFERDTAQRLRAALTLSWDCGGRTAFFFFLCEERKGERIAEKFEGRERANLRCQGAWLYIWYKLIIAAAAYIAYIPFFPRDTI